ncbi:hypothetical protein HBH26_19900, partial [Sphingomonas sp. 36D10-4-7]|nr:hypothetical protein [Sphingomonas corticis]
MSDFDIEAIRAEVRAMDFTRGTPAEVAMWREDMAESGAPQGLSYGQRQSEQMVNKSLSVAAKYIKFRGFVRLDELEVT